MLKAKKDKLFKFLFELSAQASASNSLSVTERGSMTPLSEEVRKLMFAGDQQEGVSAEKPWPGEPITL